MAKEAEQAKATAEKEQETRRAEEDRQRRREAAAPTTIWEGAWWNRSKPDVQDLAFALGLLMDGTKEELVKRIRAHLDQNPTLKSDARFKGLYSTVTRGRRKSKPQA